MGTVNLQQRRLVYEFTQLFKQLHHENGHDFRDTKNKILSLFTIEELIHPPVNVVCHLVKQHGFDPNITTTRDGWNLLMFACVWQPGFWSEGYRDLIQHLIDLGLDLNHRDHKGDDLAWYCQEYKCDKLSYLC